MLEPSDILKAKILIVDDLPANVLLLERMLSAVNGSLGIEAAHNERPAVILMDINLPGINGFEALRILREDPATAHIPVIALSANAMPRDIERGLAAGFFRYLTKPIKVDQFMEALDTALLFSQTALAAAVAKEAA